MKLVSKLSAYGALALAVLIIDRITKLYALQWCVEPYLFNSFIACRLVFNRGISWGLLHMQSPTGFMLVSLGIVIITTLLLAYAISRSRQGHCIAGEIMVVAGSISNVYDRVVYGGVVDFIQLSYNGYSWPIFNIADSAIVAGVGLMLYLSIRSAR